MATVTAPIMTDATGQSIDSKLNSLLGKMDNLAAAFQPNASGIVYSNTTSGLTGDDVQEAIDEMAADVSEIKQSLSNLGIVAHTVVSETSINTVQTNTYGTLLSRKFSDYSLLIFMVLNTDDDMRGTSIIPSSLWTTDKQISINVLHGTASADARDFKVSTVTFKYASDSGVHMWTANNGAFTRVKIMGIKLG